MTDDIRIYRKRGETVVRQIAGETLVIPIRGRLADMQRIFAMDKVAEYIWKQIDGQSSVGRIAEEITARFDVGVDVAMRDLNAFITALSAEGLIEAVEPPLVGKARGAA